jgi:hypothetical protein
MPKHTLTFRLVTGSRISTRRAIGFLEGHTELDAGISFDDLKDNAKYTVRSRFDLWLDEGICDKYFHGFKNDSDLRFRDCFVFKWKKHRWYGFLCNPRPKSNPAYLLCVLAIHAMKNEHDTDREELKRVWQWQGHLGGHMAIASEYPEYFDWSNKWKN